MTLTGADATEAAFKALAPGRRFLHLATHGFFLEGSCPTALDARSPGAWGGGDLYLGLGENPLLLSGLALAGANRRAEAGPEEEDGILTAEEVAALDLSRAEWVVLSACETGMGEIQVGEGVVGLRRAFQVAGASTVIMSLWSVQDDAAHEWMVQLYRGRLAQGLSTAEAVRQASVGVLEARRARGESTHPFFWAGFVAAGDWE
jgi:CHAT domain-containing protein